ncbi:hypothetical protein R3P38DRAFT_2981826 [Favolaschia claudopus]|uniref:Uncharacterized protein n=1 Tax=Favolaschia claudopus TaxID=2862362 RepID=A0AAW0AY98_9AGAR
MFLFFHALTAALLAQSALALVPIGRTASGRPMYVAPNGSRGVQVGNDLQLLAPNGTLLHTFANVVSGGSKRSSTLARRGDVNFIEASTPLTRTDTLQAFNTSFVVPPIPAAFDSQLLYLNAAVLVSAGDSDVPFAEVRAVLQYGANAVQGGSYWSIGTQLELIPDGGIVAISPSRDFDPLVQPGTEIVTSSTFNDVGDRFFRYLTQFPFIPGSPVLDFSFNSPALSVAIGLETVGVVKDTDYPAGSVSFKQTNLTLESGAPEMVWNVSGAGTPSSGGPYLTVDVDGSTNAEFTVHF